MSKTVFTIVLPEPKVRKKQAPPAKAHKDQHAYTRKRKHKNGPDADGSGHREKALEPSGAFLIQTFYNQTAVPPDRRNSLLRALGI